MRFRKLRIAWSVICGIACVLLIVLWVRSYWWRDSISRQPSSTCGVSADSVRGELCFCVYHWRSESYWMSYSDSWPLDSEADRNSYAFQIATTGMANGTMTTIGVTHWFVSFLSAVLAALSWL